MNTIKNVVNSKEFAYWLTVVTDIIHDDGRLEWIDFKVGRKYIRVYKPDNTIYCIIDDVGNIRSEKEKMVRGNLFNKDNGVNCCGKTGLYYVSHLVN